jgi:hypothetical protein
MGVSTLWQEKIMFVHHIASVGFLCYFPSQVPATSNAKANKPSLTPEEKKIKAQELRCFF